MPNSQSAIAFAKACAAHTHTHTHMRCTLTQPVHVQLLAQVPDSQSAIAFANAYAAEHLIVNVEDAESWLPHINNAGSIFLGRWVVRVVSGEKCQLQS